MEENDTASTISSLSISQQDINKLDTNKLTDNMLKGIYVLEAALFSQAGFEFDRVNKMRKIINSIEADILNEESLKGMDQDTKIKIYHTLIKSMNFSLEFLQELHGNISSGIDALTNLEKMKSKKIIDSSSENNSPENKEKLDIIKSLIERKIKEKIKERGSNESV